MRKDTDLAVRAIMQWSKKPKWASHLDETLQLHLAPVCEKQGMSEKQALSKIYDEGFGDMLYGLALEDFLTRSFGKKKQNPVDDLLRYKTGKLSTAGRDYLRAIRDSELRLWEVQAVQPGEWVDVEDSFNPGDTFRVIEHSGSQSMRQWDILGARVIKQGAQYWFGGGILMMPRLQSGAIRQSVQNQTAGASKHELCVAIGSAWIEHIISPSIPPMFNSDGEEALFCSAYFQINSENKQELITIFDHCKDFICDDDALSWSWLSDTNKTMPDDSSLPGLVLSRQQDGRQHLGWIRIENQKLVLDCNGKQRTNQGIALIKSLAGNYLQGDPLVEYQTPEQLMQNHKAPDSPVSSQPSLREELGDKEYARIMAEFLDSHYRNVLDQPLEMLDHMSPRQAASSLNQGKVIEWLKYLDSSEVHRADYEGLPQYDTQWIWDELGITRPSSSSG